MAALSATKTRSPIFEHLNAIWKNVFLSSSRVAAFLYSLGPEQTSVVVVPNSAIYAVDPVSPEDDNLSLPRGTHRMSDFRLPETRYALSGDVNIAHQVMGAGPVDIIMVPGVVSHVDFLHEMPGYTAFLRRLSAFARVVTFDKRGQGLSDRISDAPSLEQRMDDVRAVMDAVGSQRAVIMGFSEGCAMSALFAATYPERVSQLILFGGFAVGAKLSNDMEERIAQRVKLWGTGAMIKTALPSLARIRTRSLNSQSSSACQPVLARSRQSRY
jgi:hypothetical protein